MKAVRVGRVSVQGKNKKIYSLPFRPESIFKYRLINEANQNSNNTIKEDDKHSKKK
ncbi:MAG: hypothetical protein ACOCUH_02510 [Bacteriovoracia bacterium]